MTRDLTKQQWSDIRVALMVAASTIEKALPVISRDDATYIIAQRDKYLALWEELQ